MKFDEIVQLLLEDTSRVEKVYSVKTVVPVSLPNGNYEAIQYSYVIEIAGQPYKTEMGVRQTRDIAMRCKPKVVQVKNGEVFMYIEDMTTGSAFGGGQTHENPIGKSGDFYAPGDARAIWPEDENLKKRKKVSKFKKPLMLRRTFPAKM